jgi:hypothetical protein
MPFYCAIYQGRFNKVRKAIALVAVLGALLVRMVIDYGYNSNQKLHDYYATTSQTHEKTQPPHPKPSHFSNAGGFQKRYVNSPLQGYKRTGGLLPVDAADFLQSERMWKYLNDTCLYEQDGHIAEWQYRVPYVILLGAMKVRYSTNSIFWFFHLTVKRCCRFTD